MKNKLAFTFIELFVVVTIIAIISSSGVFYFNSFIDQQKIKNQIYSIGDYLDNFDENIDNKINYDYELHFSSDSLLFYIYENVVDTDNIAIFNPGINLENGASTLQISPYLTGSIWEFKQYAKKFISTDYMDSDQFYTSTGFTDNLNYVFESRLDGEEINKINLRYYSDLNIDTSSTIEFRLTGINSQEDKLGTDYNNIIIQNILGKKEFYNNSISDSNKIVSTELYLFFESSGVEDYLKIEK